MFKLILHHTYKLAGEAVDISYNDNHGFRTAVPFLANGMAPGSGALQYAAGPSRVYVTNKPVWQLPRAVRIETWVKLTALGQRRNLVEGDRSFAFFIQPDGVLWGTFYDPAHLTPPTPSSDPSWPGANSDSIFSPNHVRHTVPLNAWTKLTYLHDGISSVRVYINDNLVGANYSIKTGVPSVGPNGVHIGHWPGDDRYTFNGDIDEVKIWKYDPDVPYKQFFCRPMSAKQIDCWREVLDGMAAMMADKEQGQRLIGLMKCIWAADEDLVRAIRSKGEAAIKTTAALNARYTKLWCSGKMGGPEMKKLMTDYERWLIKLLGQEYMRAYGRHIRACWLEYGGEQFFSRLTSHLADCDPSFAAYFKLLLGIWQPILGS